MKITSLFKTLVAVATIFVGLTFIQCGASDSQIKEIASEANKMMNCPVKVDHMTRLDSIYGVGNEVHYHCTLFSHTKDEMAEIASVKTFNANTKAVLLGMVNADNKQMKSLRRIKVVLVMEYFDKNGELFTEVRIGPKDY